MTDMTSKYLEFFKKNQVVLIFILLFVSEGIYKIFVSYGYSDIKISTFIKIGLQLFFFGVIVKSNYKVLFPVAVLLLFFFLGQIGNVSISQLIKNLIFFDRFLFVLLSFLYIKSINEKFVFEEKYLKAFEYLLLLNSILILIGVLFQIDIFKTYLGLRSGYNGLILRSGASSYIYFIALFYFVSEVFIKKNKKHLSLLIVFTSSIFIGTKTIYLAYILIVVYLIIEKKIYKRKSVVAVLLTLVTLGFIFFEKIISFLFSLSLVLKDVYDNQGLMSAIFSFRNEMLFQETLPIIRNEWSIINFLFGGGFNMHYRSQFEIIDLFYIFGIIGSVLYLFIFKQVFIRFKINFTTSCFLFSLLFLASLTGNFFYETIIPFYLIAIMIYFQKTYKT